MDDTKVYTIFGTKSLTIHTSLLEHEYHPVLDESKQIHKEGIQQYQSWIGSLLWVISLGSFIIQCNVILMPKLRTTPFQGNLHSLTRSYGHPLCFKDVKVRFQMHPYAVNVDDPPEELQNSTEDPDLLENDADDPPERLQSSINDPDLLVNDDDYPNLQTIVDHTIMSPNHDNFIHCEKRSDYEEIKEQLPTNTPSPLGEPVILSNYVHENLMHDDLTENLTKPTMRSARKFCPQ